MFALRVLNGNGLDMTIDDAGFLSSSLADWIAKHRAANIKWFDFAEGLNRFAQQFVSGVSLRSEAGLADSNLLALLLFTRVLSNFQGMMLLAERGMIVESRTLARTCLESTFFLAAMVKGDSDFVSKMLHDELHSRKAAANWVLQRPQRLDDEGGRRQIREYVDGLNRDWEKLTPLKMEQVAQSAGLADMYLFYRQFSSDAAHPTVTSLNRYVTDDKGDEIRQVRWGPNCNTSEIGETVNISCLFLLGACEAINRVFQRAAAATELARFRDNYKTLAGIP